MEHLKCIMTLFALIMAVGFTGCHKEVVITPNGNQESNQSNNQVENQSLDTLFYQTDGLEDLDLAAYTKSGIVFGMKQDSVRGYTVCVLKAGEPQESAFVIYTDSLSRPYRICKNNEMADFNYIEGTDSVEIIIVNQNDDVTIKHTVNPFNNLETWKPAAEQTRAGSNYLTPTFVLGSIASLGAGLVGSTSGITMQSLVGQMSAGGGVLGNVIGGEAGFILAGTAIIGGIALATTPVGLAIGITGGIIAATNMYLTAKENSIAKELMGNAVPYLLDWAATGKNRISFLVNVADVDPKKTNFYVGTLVADGLYITKNHRLTSSYSSWNGPKTVVDIHAPWLFEHNSKSYKARAFIEPKKTGYNPLQDYCYYSSPVVENIRYNRDPFAIDTTWLVKLEEREKSLNFTFNVKASCFEPNLQSFGVKVEGGAYGVTNGEAEVQNFVGTKDFTVNFSYSKDFFDYTGGKWTPQKDFYVVPFCNFHGSILTDNESKMLLDFKYNDRNILVANNDTIEITEAAVTYEREWINDNKYIVTDRVQEIRLKTNTRANIEIKFYPHPHISENMECEHVELEWRSGEMIVDDGPYPVSVRIIKPEDNTTRATNITMSTHDFEIIVPESEGDYRGVGPKVKFSAYYKGKVEL